MSIVFRSGIHNTGGQIDGGAQRIINVADPTSSGDAATKNYVDNNVGTIAQLSDSAVGLIVQRHSSGTTADLAQITDQSFTPLLIVDKNGVILGKSSAIITMRNDTTAGLVVKRFSATLNANLQEWQDHTTAVLGSVRNDGQFVIKGIDRNIDPFGRWEDGLTGGSSSSPYQLWNSGAGAYHLKSYSDHLEVPAVSPGAQNPYNSLTALKISGLATTVGKPTSGSVTWSTADTFKDSKGVDQLCTSGGAPGTWISGGWQLAGFYKFASALQTSGAITVAAFDEYMIVVRIVSLSATDIPALRFNADTGSNYLSRYITCASGAVTMLNAATNTTNMARLSGLSGTGQRSIVAIVSNKLAATKLGTVQSNFGTGVLATSPSIDIAGGFEWVNTAAQISSVTLLTAGGTNTIAIDSGFQVFGRDFA